MIRSMISRILRWHDRRKEAKGQPIMTPLEIALLTANETYKNRREHIYRT